MKKAYYKHQKEFLHENPDRALLVWETGTGKTVAACGWINKRRKLGRALVVCPKAIVGKWQRDLKEWGAEADVISMSQMKELKKILPKYKVLVLDEAHHFASPLFVPGASQRSKIIYEFVRKTPKLHILLLTATPVRSTPWNIHTLACYIGEYWDVKTYRQRYFYFTDMFGRWHWEKKTGWQKMVRPIVASISNIVLMSDCVDVPVQSTEVIQIPWSKENEKMLTSEYMEPAAEWAERHRAENGRLKFDRVMEIMDGYRKAIVVCHYTSQIDDYVNWIGDEREVFVLDGRTKDQDATIQNARESSDCIFIVQASMGAGFDASEFSVVIFASMSFKYVDYVQMKGRVKRINNLHANHFIHLLGGKCDKAVFETIQENRNFDVHDYLAREKFRHG